MATHECDEEDMVDVDDSVEAHDAVDEIRLPFLNANAQEEHAERELEEYGRCKVEDFLYNDPLEFISLVNAELLSAETHIDCNLHLVEVFDMRSSSIPKDDNQTTSDVCDEGQLGSTISICAPDEIPRFRTRAKTIKISSQPKALTIRVRTHSRKATVNTASGRKVNVAARISGTRV